MKKLMLLLFFASLLANCDKQKEASPETIAKGEQLFADKTCVSCHDPSTKLIGPSITEIVNTYAENNADLISFFKGETKAIVDTDPGQIAIMDASLNGILKLLKQDELEALSAYMQSVIAD